MIETIKNLLNRGVKAVYDLKDRAMKVINKAESELMNFIRSVHDRVSDIIGDTASKVLIIAAISFLSITAGQLVYAMVATGVATIASALVRAVVSYVVFSTVIDIIVATADTVDA